MSTIIKTRRGTTAEHAVFTGAEGELTVDTTKDTVVVHDNATAGGHPLLKENGIAPAIHAATNKVTPVDADEFGIWDSVSGLINRVTLANLKTVIGGSFATLAGSISQVFSVGAASAAAHAVRLDQSFIAQDFRLSLTTALPVTTADVTAASTVYAVPKTGNKIGLYNGTRWVNYESAQFSLALSALTSGKPYDVFAYINAGVPTLEFLVWTDDTTRATALAYQDGVLVKSGDATRRYLGSFYTTAATTTEDSDANRYLWNYYHRVVRKMRRIETTASWVYTTATWRQANASALNQLNFIIGVAEDAVEATLTAQRANSTFPVAVVVGTALDSVAVPSRHTYFGSTGANHMAPIVSGDVYIPSAGRHYISWLEYSEASGTTTWYGSAYEAGLVGSIKG